MKRILLLVIVAFVVFIMPCITAKALDDAVDGCNLFDCYIEDKGYSKKKAIEKCTHGSDGEEKCYVFTHKAFMSTPTYNTTVWTDGEMGCGFEVMSGWTKEDCKNGSVYDTYYNEKFKENIAHSGYNGVADYYTNFIEIKEKISCGDLSALHIIYMVIVIAAPILTIFFVTFDLIRSIISGDSKKVAKFRTTLIKRIIALFLLLLLPAIIYTLVNSLSKNDIIKDNSLIKCVIVGE